MLESLPTAPWCFLRSPADAEEVILTAVRGGDDADTVVAMGGAMVGAHLVAEAFPERWRGDELEDVERLTSLAEALFELSVVRTGTTGR
jgi:ADP-ribosylglycohydrolase